MMQSVLTFDSKMIYYKIVFGGFKKIFFSVLALTPFNFDFSNSLVLPIWKNNQVKMEYLFRMKILRKL